MTTSFLWRDFSRILFVKEVFLDKTQLEKFETYVWSVWVEENNPLFATLKKIK